MPVQIERVHVAHGDLSLLPMGSRIRHIERNGTGYWLYIEASQSEESWARWEKYLVRFFIVDYNQNTSPPQGGDFITMLPWRPKWWQRILRLVGWATPEVKALYAEPVIRRPVTFMDLAVHKMVQLDQIDDFVDMWHSGAGNNDLHKFLGMTKEEYAQWVERPSCLMDILQARWM